MREHAPRIRQLHCFGSDCGATSSEFSLLLRVTLKTVDLSMLQHLCFHELFAHDKRSVLFLVTPVTAASLRSLHLCPLSLPSQSFPSLTRFVFWYPSFVDSPPIGTHSLLRFLAGVPKLQVLHLCRIRLQSGAHESAGGAPQVELCHLRYLTYDSSSKSFVDIPSLTHLLSHIRIPVHCCIQVDGILISQNVPSDDTHALMMQLLGRRNRRRLSLYLDCDMMRYNCTQAVLEIQPEASADTGEVTGGGRIRIVFDYREPSLSESLDPFLSLSLEQVEEVRVSVSGSQDRSSKILARIWPKLTNVRNLALSLRWSFDRREYLGPLHDMLDPLRASSGRPPACPRLEALDMYVPVCEDPFLEVIGQTLASRAEADFQVRRLAIYACTFTHTTDSSPRRHVTHFDASRSIDQSLRVRTRSVWDRWPFLESQGPENTVRTPVRSSQTAKYDPIGTGWWTLVE
ncbi:hypothetical protein C8Q74DRAFT_1372576 [Fomes fomentarius]|nr:hypothetical protein C8Q74DRAFT_1372576 [Fomes fomentarius]